MGRRNIVHVLCARCTCFTPFNVIFESYIYMHIHGCVVTLVSLRENLVSQCRCRHHRHRLTRELEINERTNERMNRIVYVRKYDAQERDERDNTNAWIRSGKKKSVSLTHNVRFLLSIGTNLAMYMYVVYVFLYVCIIF